MASNCWRDVIPVHPAADMFPLLPADELKALAADIKKNGLTVPVVFWSDPKGRRFLLDGRNRLDGMEQAGLTIVRDRKLALNPWLCEDQLGDPYLIVASLNICCRNLDAEQKRDVIAKLLKAQPSKSNRAIAKQIKADHKTVASVRAEKQATGEIPQLDKTVGADGKARSKAPKKKQRRDVDDYISEKKVRLATAKDADVPASLEAEIMDCVESAMSIDTTEPTATITVEAEKSPNVTTSTDAAALWQQVEALSTEFLIYDGNYSAKVRAWCEANPDNPYRKMLAGFIADAVCRMITLAQEIEGCTPPDNNETSCALREEAGQ
jgi:hypothetical protein